jgi:hypothetical protein
LLRSCSGNPRVLQKLGDSWTPLRDERPTGTNQALEAHYVDGSYELACVPDSGCHVEACDFIDYDDPRLLLAPVRNTLIALPEDVDPDLAFRLWDAIAEGCHDELDLNLLRWTGTTVMAEGDDAVGLPN